MIHSFLETFFMSSTDVFQDLPEDEENEVTFLEGEGYDYVEDEVVIGETITDEVYADFIGKPDAKPSQYKFLNKEPAARSQELVDLVIRRIIAAKTAKPTPWGHEAVVKAAKYTIVQLAAERDKTGKVTAWTISEEDAEKLARGQCMTRALKMYEEQEILNSVTRLNESVGVPDKGMIVGDGKRGFYRELFHAIAEKKPTFIYPAIKLDDDGKPKETLTQEQKKARTRYTQKCVNFKAASAIAKEIADLKKKIGDREYTPEENSDMDELRKMQLDIWNKFWVESGTAITNAEVFFGRTAVTGKPKRPSLKTVFRSAVTHDSVSFGIHEQS
jgi:hypothetical protein